MDLLWHPIASVFPMMDDDDIQGLALNIRANGQKQPITLFEGKVLDGRNRAAACKLEGIEPKTVEFKGTKSEALDHAWSLNRVRRHLDSSQAAIAEARRAKLSEEYAADVERLKADAKSRIGGDKKSEAAKSSGKSFPNDSGKVREQRAKSAGTNAKYIDAADKIEAERPDLGDKILKGEMTIPQAKREMEVAAVTEPPCVEEEQATSQQAPVPTFRNRMGVQRANEAIDILKKIHKSDELRDQGFAKVISYIKQRQKEFKSVQ